MQSYSWLQLIRVLAGRDPGDPDIPDTGVRCLNLQPPTVTSMLTDGVAKVWGVPNGGDIHEPIPAAAWRRIRIEFRTSRSKDRLMETLAVVPSKHLGEIFASRSWRELQVTGRELAKLEAALARLAQSTPSTFDGENVLDESPAPTKRKLTAKVERECKTWLVQMMKASPNSPRRKQDVRSEAFAAFDGLGARAFDRTWAHAVEAAEAETWSRAGTKKRRKSIRDAIPAKS